MNNMNDYFYVRSNDEILVIIFLISGTAEDNFNSAKNEFSNYEDIIILSAYDKIIDGIKVYYYRVLYC